MLKHTRIQRYKSLVDVSVDLEPLTVFIGPNGSGKSNYCEALEFFSEAKVVARAKAKDIRIGKLLDSGDEIITLSLEGVQKKTEHDAYSVFSNGVVEHPISLTCKGAFPRTIVYDFVPADISKVSPDSISSSGKGIANSLAKILFDNRDRFVELEKRFAALVPNISRIKLDQDANRNNLLYLVDRYSGFEVSAASASDGTLRMLAFLTALYDVSQPGIICFEEPENGIHPWLLNKLMQLLQTVSIEGISGKPAQIIITTHSPVLLNYVKPEQIRAVELDDKGQTKISALPVETKRFQAAMDAYDGELGELWFTNIFGGNPE